MDGTFILAAAGASLIALSLFHLAVDMWKGGSWAFPLRIIGLNALAAYMIHALVNVHELNRRIFSGAADFFPSMQPVFLLLLQWLVLFAFFRRSLFIKL